MKKDMEIMAQKILRQTDDPQHPLLRELLEKAVDESESVLRTSNIEDVSEDVIRRLSYTYYYDWETDDPDYMLLVQDPGNLHERHLDELRGSNPLGEGCSLRDQIRVYRQFGKSWLTGRNADFSERFFGTLDAFGLVDIGGDWSEYIRSETMYEDFYLGDVIKYRTDGFGRRAEEVSVNRYLSKEIQSLDPDIVFTFGGNAWSAIRGHTDPRAVVDVRKNPEKMMEIHGVLHRIETPTDTYVLPLSHMSGQVWWRFPPDEYIERLESALAEWKDG